MGREGGLAPAPNAYVAIDRPATNRIRLRGSGATSIPCTATSTGPTTLWQYPSWRRPDHLKAFVSRTQLLILGARDAEDLVLRVAGGMPMDLGQRASPPCILLSCVCSCFAPRSSSSRSFARSQNFSSSTSTPTCSSVDVVSDSGIGTDSPCESATGTRAGAPSAPVAPSECIWMITRGWELSSVPSPASDK